MTNCVVCERETSNPKFCSRSCAAKFNNARSPKRKPEGACKTCGAPVQSSRSLCAACRDKARIQEARKLANIRSWTTLAGERREAEALKAYIHASMRFSVDVRGDSIGKLKASDPIGSLLDQVSGVCFSRPEYLTLDGAKRHAVWTDELRHFSCMDFGSNTGKTEKLATDFPISQLSLVLDRWVRSFFRSKSALLSSFALQTAYFIREHAMGHYHPRYDYSGRAEDPWEIEAFLDSKFGGADHSFPDPRLKKDLTEDLGHLSVIAVVPREIKLVNKFKQVALPAGTEFLFRIERCHMSRGIYDRLDYDIEGDRLQRFDIDDGFQFYGTPLIFPHSTGERLVAPPPLMTISQKHDVLTEAWQSLGSMGPKMELPARWISHEVSFNFEERTYSAVPIPAWIAEIA